MSDRHPDCVLHLGTGERIEVYDPVLGPAITQIVMERDQIAKCLRQLLSRPADRETQKQARDLITQYERRR